MNKIFIIILLTSLYNINVVADNLIAQDKKQNILHGIELCKKAQYNAGIFYLSSNLNEDYLSDSIQTIGFIYLQFAYLVENDFMNTNDTTNVSIQDLEIAISKQPNVPCAFEIFLYIESYYSKLSNYDKVLFYKQKVHDLFIKEGYNDKSNELYSIYLARTQVLAELYAAFKYYNKAIELYLSILPSVKDCDENKYLVMLNNLAGYYNCNENYREGLSTGIVQANLAIKLFGEKSNAYINALDNQLWSNEMLWNYNDAICNVKKIISLLDMNPELNNDKAYYVKALYDLSDLYCHVEDYNSAKIYAEKMLEICTDTIDQIDVKRKLAHIYNQLQSPQKAINLLEEVIFDYRTRCDTTHIRYIAALSTLASTYHYTMEYEEKSKECYYRITNSDLMSSLSGDSALFLPNYMMYKYSAYKQLGEYNNAYNYLKEVLDCLKNRKDYYPYYINLCCRELELIFPNQIEAMTFLQEIRKKLNNRAFSIDEKIIIMEGLEVAYESLKDYVNARAIYNELLEICKGRYGEHSINSIGYLEGLIHLENKFGNFYNSEQLCANLLEILEKNYGKESSIYNNHFIMYLKLLSIENPQKALIEFLDIEEKVSSNAIIYAISNAYFSNREYEKALVYAEKRISIPCNSIDSIQGLSLKAMSLSSLGKHEKAIDCCKKAIEICERLKKRKESTDTQSLLAGLLLSNNKYKEAQNIIMSITNNELKENISLLKMLPSDIRDSYWNKISFPNMPAFINPKEYEQDSEFTEWVYYYIIRNKSFLLDFSKDLNVTIYTSNNDSLMSLYDEYLILKRNIHNLSEKEYESYQNKEVELLDMLQLKENNYTINDIKREINANEICIEYVDYQIFGKNAYCAFVLKKDWETPRMYLLGYRDSININNEVELSNFVWEPIKQLITPGDHIYFSPSGILHQIPIESLPIGDGKVMSDVYHMHRVSSTRELAMKKEKVKYEKAVLYGNLNYEMTDEEMITESQIQSDENEGFFVSRGLLDDSIRGYVWTKLGNTEREVEYISDLLNKNQVTTATYQHNKGNEESFKSLSGKGYNIIHLATHGFFYPDKVAKEKDYFKPTFMNTTSTYHPDFSMWRSGLVLSGGNRAWKGDTIPDQVEDGILKAQEISDLDLRGADLVVLSACQTGLGEITSDGVFGLQRAFKMAGAQTIVMSLTEVDDQTTMAMMNKFYTNLFSGQSKHDAFYNAQRYIRSIKPDPKYWAGWIMLD